MTIYATNQSLWSAPMRACEYFLGQLPFPDFSYLSSRYNEWRAKPIPPKSHEEFTQRYLKGNLPSALAEGYLHTCTPQQQEQLLHTLVKGMLSMETPPDLERLLAPARLIQLNEKVAEVVKGIRALSGGYPTDIDKTHQAPPPAQRARVFRTFIPHLIDTFLKAFNLLEVGKHPESVWDYHAMMNIYLSSLSLPATIFGVVFYLSASPFHAVVITAAITAALIAALYAYVRWLRPLPHNLPNCTNVHQIATPFFANRSEQLAELDQAIERGENVLIWGDTGCGKSMLALEVGKMLKKKSMQVIKDTVFQNGYLSPVERLQDPFYEANKYPQRVVFFVDEFTKVVNDEHKENLATFLRQQMDLARFQFVAVFETQYYQKNIETHKELIGRFHTIIKLTSPTSEDISKILLASYDHLAGDSDFREPLHEIADYVVKKTNERLDKKVSRSQPTAAVRLWERALKQLQQSSSKHYKSALTKQWRAKLSELRVRYRFLPPKEQKKWLPILTTLANHVHKSEQADAIHQKRIKRLHRVIAYRRNLQRQRERDIRLPDAACGDEQRKRLFFSTEYLEPLLEEYIQKEEALLPEGVTVRLDKAYIDQLLSRQETGKTS